MLGHTNIKTTQIYARITDNKIGHDMGILSGKLKEMESSFQGYRQNCQRAMSREEREGIKARVGFRSF